MLLLRNKLWLVGVVVISVLCREALGRPLTTKSQFGTFIPEERARRAFHGDDRAADVIYVDAALIADLNKWLRDIREEKLLDLLGQIYAQPAQPAMSKRTRLFSPITMEEAQIPDRLTYRPWSPVPFKKRASNWLYDREV